MLLLRYPTLATESTNACSAVNPRVAHKLSIQPPEPFLVYQYLAEIARAYNVDWCPDTDPCMYTWWGTWGAVGEIGEGREG